MERRHMPIMNQELTRALNRFEILNTIRKSSPISRVEIAGQTGLSNALVTKVTSELLKETLVLEQAARPSNTRGRRRVLLSLNPDAAHVAGLRLDSDHISFAVVNFLGEVLSSSQVPVRTRESQVQFLADLIVEGIHHCLSKAHLDMARLKGLGVGLPLYTPILENGAQDLLALLKKQLGISIYTENDANSVTLAEQWFGLGRSLENFLVVTLQNGLGLGVAVNGQLYRGTDGIAAEMGHMVLDPEGPPCVCGKKGCLEMYTSGRGMLYAARQAIKNGRWSFKHAASLTMQDIISSAQDGDLVPLEILDEAGRKLGLGVAWLIQLFNPERVILTGENVIAGDIIFNPMLEALEHCVNPLYMKPDMIVIQKWDSTNWARGAACLVLQEIYKSPAQSLRSVI
jgi:predicted NBD/HSP70 family sugar kinase